MLGRKRIEGQEDLPVLDQAGRGRLELRGKRGHEEVEGVVGSPQLVDAVVSAERGDPRVMHLGAGGLLHHSDQERWTPI